MASVNVQEVLYKFLTGSNDPDVGTAIQAALDADLSLADILASVDADGAISVPAGEDLTLGDGSNIVLDTTTGTEIGTAASQKLGFYGATPVVQASHIADASGSAADATINAIILALENVGILAAS